MTIDDLLQSNTGISPQKLAFLKSFANMPKDGNSQTLMQQLVMCQMQAKQKNIQFTDDEQKILIDLLTANLSPQEKAKVEQVLTLLKRTGK